MGRGGDKRLSFRPFAKKSDSLEFATSYRIDDSTNKYGITGARFLVSRIWPDAKTLL